ncbi:hypothetical protein [Crenothrix sp.]|uniref:hypothetical protein n=1 Tax=Crenothrix sp. TaxID=3100433 RepID=UPI00374CBF5E
MRATSPTDTTAKNSHTQDHHGANCLEPLQDTGSFKITQPRKVSLVELLQQQHVERSLDLLPLEVDLLLMRIAAGGHSGQYLADAFLSAYRHTPFKHGLGELIKLDTEGFRLFHEVLHIRHVKGWNDDNLYQIELQIKAIIGGVQ